MQYAEAHLGRIFILRLEEGEILHESVENFACEQGIRAGALIAVGGVGAGSRLVVGPADGRARPIDPLELVLADVHEAAGMGTVFPDEAGNPVLHLHAACGREEATRTGCVRRGVRVWQVLEVILFELTGTAAKRVFDREAGFAILDVGCGTGRQVPPDHPERSAHDSQPLGRGRRRPAAAQPPLTDRRRILIDLLGFGYSDRPAEYGYTLEDHADAIAQAMD